MNRFNLSLMHKYRQVSILSKERTCKQNTEKKKSITPKLIKLCLVCFSVDMKLLITWKCTMISKCIWTARLSQILTSSFMVLLVCKCTMCLFAKMSSTSVPLIHYMLTVNLPRLPSLCHGFALKKKNENENFYSVHGNMQNPKKKLLYSKHFNSWIF